MIQQIVRTIGIRLSNGYLYLFLAMACSTYIQVVLKWQLDKYQYIPNGLLSKFFFMMTILFTNLYLVSVVIAGGFGFLCWFFALKALPLNIVYPMISLCFVTVTICSWIFFKEKMSLYQGLGIGLIVIGSFLINK